MTRGGPRPNSGGRRPGAGRPQGPLLPVAEAQARIRAMLDAEDIRDGEPVHGALGRLAERLGVSGETVRGVYRGREQRSPERMARWEALIVFHNARTAAAKRAMPAEYVCGTCGGTGIVRRCPTP